MRKDDIWFLARLPVSNRTIRQNWRCYTGSNTWQVRSKIITPLLMWLTADDRSLHWWQLLRAPQQTQCSIPNKAISHRQHYPMDGESVCHMTILKTMGGNENSGTLRLIDRFLVLIALKALSHAAGWFILPSGSGWLTCSSCYTRVL